MRIAHIAQSGEEQTLAAHSLASADWAEGFGRGAGLAKTARLAARVHDFGKAGGRFQGYIRYNASHPSAPLPKGTAPHSAQGAKYLHETYGGAGGVAARTAALAALAVASHHGGLADCVSPEGERPFYERVAKEDETLCYDEAREYFLRECAGREELDALFAAAAREVGDFGRRCIEKKRSKPFMLHLLERYVFSCLVDADRYDTYRFMAGLPAAAPEEEPPWEELSEALERHLAALPADKAIGRVRAEISRRCLAQAEKPPGVFRLRVPTGGGKTLASLRFALRHARKHGMQHIFYIIPFTTIIDQNASAIRDALGRADVVLEHHSNLLPDRERDEDDEYRAVSERWDRPIVLTTMVQFLNAFYAGGTRAARRLHQLSNAVVIFDEVQSTPPACLHLFNEALNFLTGFCGSSAVLCTATQPPLESLPRPLLADRVENLVEDADVLFRDLVRTRIVYAPVAGGYTTEMLADFVLEKAEGLQSALAILNTRAHARRLFRELGRRNEALPPDKRFSLYHLSTNLCPAHRRKILCEIGKKLGRERVICVSTQLIEAGVDISFECVVRALAGLDSVAQAAGRCNRNGEHPEPRPVYVVNPAGENLSRLKAILKGKEAAERVFTELADSPDALGGGALSPEALQRYYLYYDHAMQSEFDYRVEAVAPGATLYGLLDENRLGVGYLTQRGGAVPPLWHAFGTAGEHFHVIDEDTTAVLVPYEKGGELIGRLSSGEIGLRERAALLREAQQYSVNVTAGTLERLKKERALVALPGGAYALDEASYDPETGVRETAAFPEAYFA